MEETIYFPHKEKIEECLKELLEICNNIDLQNKKFNLDNLINVKETEKNLKRIENISNQIRLALSIKVKNSSRDIDEFITIPTVRTF